MPNVIVPTDWLSDIDGLTVKDAINYLSKLNPDHKLIAYMDGDTHGVELCSELYYERPYTQQELVQMKHDRLERERNRLIKSAAYWRDKAENPYSFVNDADGSKKQAHVKYARGREKELLDKLALLNT